MCILQRNNEPSKNYLTIELLQTVEKPITSNNSTFDLHSYIESKLRNKYNLSSTLLRFEVINLNEEFSIDLEENDLKKVSIFSDFLDFLPFWSSKRH